MDGMEVLGRLVSDAWEDNRLAVYSLVIVWPVSALLSSFLLKRGMQTTSKEVYVASIAVPMLLMSIPIMYEWLGRPYNAYQTLGFKRTESTYEWGRVYLKWSQLHSSGQMPDYIWRQIDNTYNLIYSERARQMYDIWGAYPPDATVGEIALNVGLFYVYWIGIIYALTSTPSTSSASKWAFPALLAMLAFEVATRFFRYDPSLKYIFPYTTPSEFVQWGHRLLPIFVFASVSIKQLFYIDLDEHRHQILMKLKDDAQRITDDIAGIQKELQANNEG